MIVEIKCPNILERKQKIFYAASKDLGQKV